MPKNPTKKDEAWVEKYFTWWIRQLGCTPTQVTYEYSKDAKGTMTAETQAGSPYRQVSIRIYPPFWEQDQVRREQTLVHEAVHVAHKDVSRNRLMDREIYDDYDENFTDMIALVLHSMA